MLFSRTSRQRQSRKSGQMNATETVQRLEPRQMLAGNVVVSLRGSQLSIAGDSAANTIEITALDNQVIVRGLQNTTINGGTSNFVLSNGTATFDGSVVAYLGAGDDTLLLSRNVQVTGAVSVAGEAGNDNIGSTGATIQGGFAFLGGYGNDRVSLQDTSLGNVFWARTQQGDDLISLEDVTINGGIWIKAGTGADGVSMNRVNVTGEVSINTGADQDDIAIQASNFASTMRIKTKRHADTVMLDENTFNGHVSLNTGSGDDNTIVRSTNTFNGVFRGQAGDGNADGFEIVSPNTFNGRRVIRRAESATASPSVIAARIDNTTTGVIGKATAANTFFNQLLVSSPQTLSINGNRNSGITSTGSVRVTRSSSFIVDGTTTPRSTVTIDSDGDGQFDDGTTTSAADGTFSLTVTLTRRDLDTGDSISNDQRSGFQTLAVRSTDEAGSIQNATLDADLVQNSVVQFVSNEGTYEVELFDNLTPNTVANFISYFSQYTGSIIHRSVDDFVIQGGGFTINNGVIDNINTSAPIQNEFNNTTSNIRGTLSMAQLGGDINSGTSQWFVNLKDNGATLDAVPHTVFGRVVGKGMTVVDTIAALNVFNFSNVTGVSALNELPRRAPFDVNAGPEQPISGTVSVTSGSNIVTGVGTLFTQELTSINGNPGGSRSRISINGTVFNVQAIISDTQLQLSTNSTITASNVQARTDDLVDSEFVRFTSISEILDTV